MGTGVNRLLCALSVLYLVACSTQGSDVFRFERPTAEVRYTSEQAVDVKLNVPVSVDSVSVVLNKKHVVALQENTAKIPPEQLLLGENVLLAEAYSNGGLVAKKYHLFTTATDFVPAQKSVKVLRKIPHETTAFTQGLSFYNNLLYESTGEYGHSQLLIRDPKNGKLLKSQAIEKKYFAEGSTFFNDELYLITWQAGEGWRYHPQTLERIDKFDYFKYSKEGWGLTTVGDELVMSNGSENLLFFNPRTMQLQHSLSVHSNKGRQTMLNELEYDGKYIYANVWLQNYIVVINPRNGRIEATVDCTDLVAAEPAATTDDAVLNGIAYNPATQTFFLTGKKWRHIYEVEFYE